MGRGVFTATLAASLLGCGGNGAPGTDDGGTGTGGSECNCDSDCKDDRVCVDGVCVTPEGGCETDFD